MQRTATDKVNRTIPVKAVQHQRGTDDARSGARKGHGVGDIAMTTADVREGNSQRMKVKGPPQWMNDLPSRYGQPKHKDGGSHS